MQELTDEDLFVLGVQDFLCNRRSDKKSEPIDTSGTFEEFHERMVALSNGNDHFLDAIRYVVMGVLTHKPRLFTRVSL